MTYTTIQRARAIYNTTLFLTMTNTIQREIAKQKERGRDRVKKTGEVFTPMDLCLRMVKEIPESKLKDPDAKFLDNSCGDGNFLVALFKVLSKYHDGQHVLDNMIYGVDLMPDNVAEAKRRLGLTPEMAGWHHVVCADGLKYDYEFAPPPPAWSASGYSLQPISSDVKDFISRLRLQIGCRGILA